jgi:hypothetical protein
MSKLRPLALLIFSFASAVALAQQTGKTNGSQPTRFNIKRLINDPTSQYYNPSFTWPKDNLEQRILFDINRLKDPVTGRIPDNIAQKELQYVRSAKSKMQIDRQESLRTRPNLQMALGDQVSPWINRGPYNVGGRTRALAIDLDDEQIILAGGVSGGMWRSTNQGTSWTRVTDGDDHPTVTDIEQDARPGFHDTWYYSTGERIGASQSARNASAFLQGNGIYKSTDNGLTWTVLAATQNTSPQTFNSPFDLIHGIEVNPANGDLYVASLGGISRSTDGGTSFQLVLSAEFDDVSDIHITSSGIIYATLDMDGGSTADGIYRTTNGGVGTWVDIAPPTFPTFYGRTVIHTAPSNENILYVLVSGTSTAPVDHDFWKYTYVSGDGSGAGGTWENRSGNLPDIGGNVGDFNSQGGYDLYVRIHPTNSDLVFVGGTNIYRSTNGFSTNSGEWIGGYSPDNDISLYSKHHPDQHSLEFFPSNPNKVISGHDGGLSITADITASNPGVEKVAWASLNNGYLNTQVYALSIGPTTQLMAGFQDNSTWFTNNTTPTDSWVDLFSGDGSYNSFNSDGTIRYVSAQTGIVYRVTYPNANSSEPSSFTEISPAEGIFVAPFEMDPNTDLRMYYAGQLQLWRNNNLPAATTFSGWTLLFTAPANISTIGISKLPANVVYFGTTNGRIYKITNAHTGTPAPVDISTGKGLPTGNVSSISINETNADDVIITFSNYSIISVYHSLNGGTTWTSISGNMEENVDGTGSGSSVRWAARVGNNYRYLLATSTGLYSTITLNGTSTVWTQEDLGGIRNVVVEQIRVRNSDGLVAIGSHGNGIYTANFEVTSPTSSPGGVATALKLWLKADAGTNTSTEGSGITSWTDQSPAGNHATGTGLTTYLSSFSNYNPGLNFTSDNQPLVNTSNTISRTNGTASSILVVGNIPEVNDKAIFEIRGGGVRQYFMDNRYANSSTSYSLRTNENTVWTISDPGGVSNATVYENGENSFSSAKAGTTNWTANGNYYIGDDQTPGGNQLTGKIAEVIYYDQQLSASDQQKVESYLAIKYGITRDNSVGDLRASDGTLVWDASNNPSYQHDIIALGRDDPSAMYQKQSRTPDDSLSLYIDGLAVNNISNAGSITNDISFVVMGHNGERLLGKTTEIPPGVYSRFAREWKITNTNFNGDYGLDFKWEEGGSFDIADIRLLVDNDGDFSNATIVGPADGLTFSIGSIRIENISASHIPANSTRFVTIASISAASPLPIELISFIPKSLDNGTVQLNWTTASETNNHYFTIEKSKDGKTWNEVATVAGAGNSNVQINYSTIDYDPYHGTSYYRLKQTDFDGTHTYSRIKSVYVSVNAQVETKVVIYPNPAQHEIFIKGESDEFNQLTVYNVFGQDVTAAAVIRKVDTTTIAIDLSGLRTGLYIIKTRTTASRIVKQ